MSFRQTFLHGLAIGIDTGCELVFNNWRTGAPMTISSRAGLALRASARKPVLICLGRVLNWLNPGHCEDAIAADIGRCQEALRELQAAITGKGKL